MTSRIPIPPGLRRTAFRTSDPASGLGRGRLRGDGVAHPFHGVSAIDLDPGDVRDRVHAFAPNLLPGQVYSHTTALSLHGAALPRLPADLHVTVRFPRTPPRGRGITGHSLGEAPALLLDGLPVAPPEVAWAQAGALLGVEDLVAAGDALVTGARMRGARAPGRCTPQELSAIAARWRGRPGAARLARAAALVRVGAESRPESLLRLLLFRHRLPEPVVDIPIRVAGGRELHVDLGYPELRLALEYEGDGHRTDRRQWELDIERRELLEDVGWGVIRVTRHALFVDPAGLVARVRTRRGQRGGDLA